MHPNISDVKSQNIHVEAEARVRMKVRTNGHSRTTTGVKGNQRQNASVDDVVTSLNGRKGMSRFRMESSMAERMLMMASMVVQFS